MLTLVTYIKPVPQNRKLKRGKGSRLFLDKDFTLTWQAIQSEWKRQYLEPTLTGKVSIEILFGWSRMDIDSCIKPILDYLQGICYTNDKQVISLKIERIQEEKIEIKITQNS